MVVIGCSMAKNHNKGTFFYMHFLFLHALSMKLSTKCQRNIPVYSNRVSSQCIKPLFLFKIYYADRGSSPPPLKALKKLTT